MTVTRSPATDPAMLRAVVLDALGIARDWCNEKIIYCRDCMDDPGGTCGQHEDYAAMADEFEARRRALASPRTWRESASLLEPAALSRWQRITERTREWFTS